MRLIARAYPASGLDAEAEIAPPMVLAPEGRTADLETLCPAGVELVAWTGVGYGARRGLLFRRVLGAAALRPRAVEQENSRAGETSNNGNANRMTAVDSGGGRAAAQHNCNGAGDMYVAPTNGLEVGDEDGLSASEISDLGRSFDLDQLT